MTYWRPISSAPKDGTEIRLGLTLNWDEEAREEESPRVGTGFYDCGAYWYVPDVSIWKNRLSQLLRHPTHWMPLSPLPNEEDVCGCLDWDEYDTEHYICRYCGKLWNKNPSS